MRTCGASAISTLDEAAALGTNALRGRGRPDRRRRDLCMVANYAVFINTLTFRYFLAGGIAFSASRMGLPLRTGIDSLGLSLSERRREIEQYRYREGAVPRCSQSIR